MRDAVLGDLVEDALGLTGRLLVEGESIEVTVLLDGAPAEEVLPAARALAAELPALLPRARQELVKALLPVVNGGYLEPGQAPIGEEEFLRRARLAGATIDSESNLTFQFADDDMLWGHWMSVDTDARRLEWRASAWG